MAVLKIGVLALQGAFTKHEEMLRKLGVEAKEIRKPKDLDDCDGLIIPGGESTTMMHHIKFIGLEEQLALFAEQKPVFGTCAGLILISSEILRDNMKPFSLIDISVERNAFGRQADSFMTEVEFSLPPRRAKSIPALFIRAPKIKRCGSEVQVLATFHEEPVLVKQGKHLASTFHPELTDDVAVHQYFLSLCQTKQKQ